MEQLTCGHCGHTGPDVKKEWAWLGGRGFTMFTKCKDDIECWKRWDKKNLNKEIKDGCN